MYSQLVRDLDQKAGAKSVVPAVVSALGAYSDVVLCQNVPGSFRVEIEQECVDINDQSARPKCAKVWVKCELRE